MGYELHDKGGPLLVKQFNLRPFSNTRLRLGLRLRPSHKKPENSGHGLSANFKAFLDVKYRAFTKKLRAKASFWMSVTCYQAKEVIMSKGIAWAQAPQFEHGPDFCRPPPSPIHPATCVRPDRGISMRVWVSTCLYIQSSASHVNPRVSIDSVVYWLFYLPLVFTFFIYPSLRWHFFPSVLNKSVFRTQNVGSLVK